MIQRNDKWLDVMLAQQSLGWAKYFGKLHLDNTRLMSQWGSQISETDLQRILAYNKIRDLNPQDINVDNVDFAQEAIKWAQWIPKVDYGKQRDTKFFDKEYLFCGQCSEKVPMYVATFPDGRSVSSWQEHTRSCVERTRRIEKEKYLV